MIPSGKSLTFKDLLQNGSLSFSCAAVTVILLPVYHWYLPPIMIAWGLLRVVEISQTADPVSEIKKGRITLFFFFIVFYAWQIVGMVYSENPDAGWRNIVLRMSLFLFPLVLFSPGDTISRRAGFLVRLFALSNLMFLIFCYGFAVWRSITIIDGTIGFNPHPHDASWLNYFYAMKLAVFQHPSYLSMYTLLSVFISFEAFYDNKLSPSRRKLWLLASMSLLISVYFLSSRAGILTAIISIPFYFFRRSKRTGKSRKMIFAVILSIIILVPVFLTNPRVNGLFRTLSHKENNEISAQDGRLTIWTSVTKIARDNMLFGVGTGDIQDELDKEYIRIGKTGFAKDNFNAHNQYIEILLENGAIGLFLFLAIFGMIFYIAIKDWNLIYAMFILIVFISFMFETMLNRLAGVTFFALFSFLLSFVDSDYGNS